MGNTYFYTIRNGVYVNLTNRCTNLCAFCIRDTGGLGKDYELWLDSEPSAQELIQAFDAYDTKGCDEVVFCGFGEPLIRLDEVLALSRHIKTATGKRIRVNTNGHANLIHQRDVTPELAGLIDSVSISLNAKNAQDYVALCRPDFGAEAFDGLIDFAKKCRAYVPEVVLSVVDKDMTPEDIKACRAIAASAGVPLRVRTFAG